MATFIVLTLLVVALGFALRSCLRQKKTGGCPGGCSGCSHACGCHGQTEK